MLAATSHVRARCPHLTAEDVSVLDEELLAALQVLSEVNSRLGLDPDVLAAAVRARTAR